MNDGTYCNRRIATNETLGAIDLRMLGIDAAQAAELRARLASFVGDWDSPEMAVYDRYETAKAMLDKARS